MRRTGSPAGAGVRVAAHPRPKPSTTRSLASVLDAYMKDNDLTLQAMSERSGLAVATIAALRGGTRGKRPHPTTVEKLAAAMGVSPAELDVAVATSAGPARMRETELLSRFRQLDEDAKVAVETLLARLVSRRREPPEI